MEGPILNIVTELRPSRCGKGDEVVKEVAAEKEKWEKLDAKAQTWIVTRMSETVMTYILTCTTSAECERNFLPFANKNHKPAYILSNNVSSNISMRDRHVHIFI